MKLFGHLLLAIAGVAVVLAFPPRIVPNGFDCVRYLCDVQWCIMDDSGPAAEQLFHDRATCLFWAFMGNDCGTLAGSIVALSPDQSSLVVCPAGGRVYRAPFQIWRSPYMDLEAQPLRYIWGADAKTSNLVNQPMLAATCVKEEKKIHCRRGASFNDCVPQHLSCPLLPNPDWTP